VPSVTGGAGGSMSGAGGSGGAMEGGSAGASAAGAGTSGTGGGGLASGCDGGQLVAPELPALGWQGDAETVALYRFADLSDSGVNALALADAGATTFGVEGLDWSGDPGNQAARFSLDSAGVSRGGLTVGGEFTLEARVMWRGFTNRSCGQATRLVALTNGSDGVSFEQPCGVASGALVRVGASTELASAAELDDVMDYQWHLVRLVISAGAATFFVDGVQRGGSLAVGSLGNANWTLTVGDYFDGWVDELRLSSVARPGTGTLPIVAARPAYTELTGAGASAALTANLGAAGSVVWSVVSGPGSVVFDDPNAATTTATFCAPGKYVLRALAYDGEYTADDLVVVRVWPAEGRDIPYKTLFIGNSFSFYNGTVGYRYWEFAKQAGEAMGETYAGSELVKMLTSPGQTYQYHWYELNSNGECTDCADHVLPAPPTVNLSDYPGQNAQAVLRDGEWDVVFLQNHSAAPATDPTNFARYGKKLDRLIKLLGGRTVFYQTWAYPGASNTISVEEIILGNYETLAADTGAALSRAGRAFQYARENHDAYGAWPAGVLFSDNHHPSSFGTYLIGAVHFATVYGVSPGTVALYPGPDDVPSPEMTTDTARADLMRTIAAMYVPATPLAQGD
jgi:hypothetical protein